MRILLFALIVLLCGAIVAGARLPAVGDTVMVFTRADLFYGNITGTDNSFVTLDCYHEEYAEMNALGVPVNWSIHNAEINVSLSKDYIQKIVYLKS